MRLAALAVTFAVLAAPALAQDARIRSGEHETFSRLVIYLPEAAEYRDESGEGSFAIDFGGDFGFDLSEVFVYIPQTRLADISGEAGRLELSLACDCAVTVQRLSATSVFLDVNDPGTVAVELPEPKIEILEADTETPAPNVPSVRLPVTAAGGAATLLPGGLDLPRGMDVAGHDAGAVAPSPRHDTRADPESAHEPAQLVSDTTQAVAEQIARATAQGLLEAEGLDLPLTRPVRRPEQEAPASDEPDAPAEDPETRGTRRHVSIRSSIDDALGRDVGRALSDLGMAGPCLPDETFDAANWLPEEQVGFARLRTRVLGEFDRPDAEGVADLARAYIAMTFGAEAGHALRSFKVTVPDSDILLAMSEIVDDGKASHPGRLVTQYDCPGTGALWAALSASRIPDAAELDTAAVALAFSALPPHLRTHLGPALAERLIGYGAVDTASVVRTAILRAPGTPSVETELLEASIALKHGREEEADAKLAEVVDETSGRSVEAVERLIERRLAAGEPVEDEVLAAADALIYEHRGTPLAYRMSELRIEGLAKSGKSRRAIDFLAETEKHLPPETADRLRGVVYIEAARLLDDPEFLLVAVKAPAALGHSPEEMAARRALARRLAGMKLFALADSLGVVEIPDADTAPAAATPAAPTPALRVPMPVDSATLKRSAALLENSAALRERLAAALADKPQ